MSKAPSTVLNSPRTRPRRRLAQWPRLARRCSAGRGTAIIVVLADSRFDRLYAAFCDCLNRKYVEAGALPIVTLLYTDMGRMAETLCGFFSFQEEGTPVLATGRNVDFFCPK